MNRFWMEHSGAVLLIIAALGWYVSMCAATVAMTATHDTAGRRAIAAWLCNAPIVLIATVWGRYDIAVGMIFATSVASVTMVLGIVTLAAEKMPVSVSRRPWGMLLPLALLNLLIGFSGGFQLKHSGLLVAQGLAILWVWNDPAARSQRQPKKQISYLPALLGAALIGAIVAGLAGFFAATRISLTLGMPNSALVTAVILAPAMVLSLIGLGMEAVQRGHYVQCAGGLIGFVMLNLCASLPVTTVVWLMGPYWKAPAPIAILTTAPSATSPADEPPSVADLPPALPYPMAIWRVDTVLLIAVGLLLLPVSWGHWTLGAAEGIGLLLTYVIFMLLTVLVVLTHWF